MPSIVSIFSLSRTSARKDRLSKSGSFSLSKRFTSLRFLSKSKAEHALSGSKTTDCSVVNSRDTQRNTSSEYSRPSHGDAPPNNKLNLPPPPEPPRRPNLESILINPGPQSPRPPQPDTLSRNPPSFIGGPQTPKVKLPPPLSARVSPIQDPNRSNLVPGQTSKFTLASSSPLQSAPPPNSPLTLRTSSTPYSPGTYSKPHSLFRTASPSKTTFPSKPVSPFPFDKPLPSLPERGTTATYGNDSKSSPRTSKPKNSQHQTVLPSESADSSPTIRVETKRPKVNKARSRHPPRPPASGQKASKTRSDAYPDLYRASRRQPPPLWTYPWGQKPHNPGPPPARPKRPSAFLSTALHLPRPQDYPWQYIGLGEQDKVLPPQRCTRHGQGQCYCNSGTLAMRSRISNVQDLAIMPGCETGLVSLEPTNPGIPNVEDDLQWPLRTPQCPARPPTIFYKANPHVAATDLETATQLLFTLEADHAGQLFIWEYLGYLEEIVCRYTLPDQAPYQQAKGLVEDLETMAKAFGIPKSEYLVWELGGLAKKDREAREKMRAREEKKAREEKRTSTEKRTSAESKTRKQRRTREERKVREERRARAEKKLEEEKKAEEERNTQIEELRTMLHEILGEVDATPDEQTEMQLEYLGRVISDLGEELEQTIDKMGKGGAGKHCRVEVRRKKGGQQGGGAEQNV